ncbi:MAG: GNAT family N-acetyltransferase [Reyranella sp.]|uniref:GNAT family N-acetyltransferase n=1 Tax=Reyranella sp. TaxID=1929291 RepID=UPI00272FBE6A|nr:GNAT family N-acetyltransferase [Reyranella sp.]MDP1962297.1 GNAT family N-acetyltransferase [Reyranella sp.]MDP2372709.1 GNAT family N-acetyltransferase [Reyranella sp.]
MVEWRFRDATEEDFEPLLAIRIDVMREHLERVFRYKPSRARRIFSEHFAEPGMRAIIIEGELAGCVAFRKGADAIKLDSFYLHRRHHNGGLGTTILKVLLAEADAAGLPVRLEVLTGSKADRFYTRHGFVKLSEDEIEGEYERPAGGQQISALLPRGQGHQFVIYGDACSGVAGALHERTFASVNAAVRRLTPSPEFILFLGDEIAGYTADADTLRRQWRHWLDHEMGWLDRRAIPMWHTTSNHATYDVMSEAVFREVHDHLPRNGPPGQEGLSYWVRQGDLLLVFVHTLWTGLGGEGHVETDWLRAVLHQHADARHKLVAGHHPVHPVNGFVGPYQRDVGPEHAAAFWNVLTEAGVLAYLCGHILAFDVQAHRGVLQICTAGAGTAHRMPEGVEYLHAVQAALDARGLRYQVFDAEGRVRERLSWPLAVPPVEQWQALNAANVGNGRIVALRFSGHAAGPGTSTAQTFLSAVRPGMRAPLWIGLRGPEQRLAVILELEPGRSPRYWLGPAITAGAPFDIQLLIHPDMGPGGLLYRLAVDAPWTSLSTASAWGAERLGWPERWSVGHGQNGPEDRAFLGSNLAVSATIVEG